MIEILVLYGLCKGIGKMARAKGRGALGFQILLIALWFLGQFCGSAMASVILLLVYGTIQDEAVLFNYVIGLPCGVLGAMLAQRIVRRLPERLVEEVA